MRCENKVHIHLPDHVDLDQALVNMAPDSKTAVFVEAETDKALNIWYVTQAESRGAAIAEASRHVQRVLTGRVDSPSYTQAALLACDATDTGRVFEAAKWPLVFWHPFLLKDLRGDTYLCALSLYPETPQDDQETVGRILEEIALKFQR